MATRRVSDAAGAMRGVFREAVRADPRPEARTPGAGGPSAASVVERAERAERAERFKAWLEASPLEWREFFEAP